jgi:hypothetical protein
VSLPQFWLDAIVGYLEVQSDWTCVPGAADQRRNEHGHLQRSHHSQVTSYVVWSRTFPNVA